MLMLLLVELVDECLEVEVYLSGCLVLKLLLEDSRLNSFQFNFTRRTHTLQTLTGQLPLLRNMKEIKTRLNLAVGSQIAIAI